MICTPGDEETRRRRLCVSGYAARHFVSHGLEAADIAEIVGTSRSATGMKVHRIERLLARQLNEGATHDR